MRAIFSLLLIFAIAMPSVAAASDGRKLIMAFMDLCVLNDASPPAVRYSAEAMGLQEVSASPFPFLDLGERFSNEEIYAANDPAFPYVIRLLRSDRPEDTAFVCELADATIDAEQSEAAYAYLPKIANLGESDTIGPMGTFWHAPNWGEGSSISYSGPSYSYPTEGASVRFISMLKKP